MNFLDQLKRRRDKNRETANQRPNELRNDILIPSLEYHDVRPFQTATNDGPSGLIAKHVRERQLSIN